MTQPRVVQLSADTVELRNVTRTSLSFQIPGQAIHLFPGAKVAVPSGYLKSGELEILHREGALVVVTPPPAATPVAARRVTPSDGSHTTAAPDDSTSKRK